MTKASNIQKKGILFNNLSKELARQKTDEEKMIEEMEREERQRNTARLVENYTFGY